MDKLKGKKGEAGVALKIFVSPEAEVGNERPGGGGNSAPSSHANEDLG